MPVFKAQCFPMIGPDFTALFGARTSGPLVLAMILLVALAASQLVAAVTGKKPMDKDRLGGVFMNLMFSFFTAVVALVLVLFVCAENPGPNEDKSLAADMSITCYNSDTWKQLIALSIVAIV